MGFVAMIGLIFGPLVSLLFACACALNNFYLTFASVPLRERAQRAAAAGAAGAGPAAQRVDH